MGIGPVPSTRKLMERLGLKITDFDLIGSTRHSPRKAYVLRQLGVPKTPTRQSAAAPLRSAIRSASGARLTLTAVHGLGAAQSASPPCASAWGGRAAGDRKFEKQENCRADVTGLFVPSNPQTNTPPPASMRTPPCVRAEHELYAPERNTPCDAPKEKLFALRDFLSTRTSSSGVVPFNAPWSTARS